MARDRVRLPEAENYQHHRRAHQWNQRLEPLYVAGRQGRQDREVRGRQERQLPHRDGHRWKVGPACAQTPQLERRFQVWRPRAGYDRLGRHLREPCAQWRRHVHRRKGPLPHRPHEHRDQDRLFHGRVRRLDAGPELRRHLHCREQPVLQGYRGFRGQMDRHGNRRPQA